MEVSSWRGIQQCRLGASSCVMLGLDRWSLVTGADILARIVARVDPQTTNKLEG
jgi:hypothetical protein